MTERYKIWVNIEKITGEGENEVYEDVAPFPWLMGEYKTYEEAQAKINEMTDPTYPGSFAVVDRVWDGEEGIHPTDALSRGIKIDCWFIRKDGWTLGTPKEHIESAAELWQDEWSEVLIMEDNVPAVRLTYEEWHTCAKNQAHKEG